MVTLFYLVGFYLTMLLLLQILAVSHPIYTTRSLRLRMALMAVLWPVYGLLFIMYLVELANDKQ